MSLSENILGIIIQATDAATPVLKSVGSAIQMTGRSIDEFATKFNAAEKAQKQSLANMKRDMGAWQQDIMKQKLNDPFPNQQSLNAARGRYKAFMDNMAEESAKYHRQIMAGVAMSMTGFSVEQAAMPVVNGFKKMIQSAMDYQQELQKITLTTGNFGNLSGKALDNANASIQRSITAAGIMSPLSNKDMADMTSSLATMGLHKAPDLNSMIAPAMVLQAISAKAGGGYELNPTQAAQLLSSLVMQNGKGLGNLSTMKLGSQTFNGVSSNAMQMVDQMTKAYHDAHMTYADQMSMVNSAGASMATSGMDYADMVGLAGAMRRMGLNPRRAGMDIQGLVTDLQKFQSQMAMGYKPGSLTDYAAKLGFNMSNMKNGDFVTQLFGVIKKAQDTGQMDILSHLANTTGNNVLQAMIKMAQQKQLGNIEMDTQGIIGDVRNSQGYGANRFNVLSQTPEQQWKQFQGTLESIGQTVGMTLLPGLNALLGIVNNLAGAVLKFTEEHPLLTKLLGAGVGLAGLVGVASGAILIFRGQLISATASLKNFRIQQAMAAANTTMFYQKMRTGDEVMAMSASETGGLGKMILKFGALGAAGFLLYEAWNSDFMGIQTTLSGFWNKFSDTYDKINMVMGLWTDHQTSAFNKQVADMNKQGDNWSKFAGYVIKAATTVSAAFQMLLFGHVDHDQWDMLTKSQQNLVKTLSNLAYEGKTFITGFLQPFKTSWKELQIVLTPVITPLKWIAEKFFGISFGGGKGKDLTALGKGIGWVASQILLLVAAFKVYGTIAGKGLKLFGWGKDIFGGFKDGGFKGGMQNLFGNPIKGAITGAKGLLVKVLGPDAVKVGQILADSIRTAMIENGLTPSQLRQRGINNQLSQMNGEYTTWWEGASKAPKFKGRDINKINRWLTLAEKYEAQGKPLTKEMTFARNFAWHYQNGTLPHDDISKLKKAASMYQAPKGSTGLIENFAEDVPQVSKWGKFAGTFGKVFGVAGKILGPLGMIGSVLMSAPGIVDAFKKDGIGGATESFANNVLGISKKGGWGGAASGALSGAGIGMMFGPIGALVGAIIGAILGGIGTDRIKNWWHGQMTQLKGEWNTNMSRLEGTWNNFQKRFPVAAKAVQTVFQQYWTLTVDFFTGKWAKLGGDLKVISGTASNGIKTIFMRGVDVVKNYFVGKWHELMNYLQTAPINAQNTLRSGFYRVVDDIKWYFIKKWNDVVASIYNNPLFQKMVKLVENHPTLAKLVGVNINGSHATGLSYVPFDGYVAELHRGERVLTADEAQALRQTGSINASSSSSDTASTTVHFGQGSIQIVMSNASAAEVERAAEELFRKFMKKVEKKNISNYKPSRMRGALN